jgi:hypothetical protein
MALPAMQPLTHHQIIGLVEPFTRCGRHVDLGASNRLERWLVLKPVENTGDTALRETLKLENPYDGYFRLTRGLHGDNGLEASLMAEGADAGELLQRIEAVAPQRQFSDGAGFVIALSFRLDASNMILTDAVAQFAGYTLSLRVPRTKGMAGEIELAAPAGSVVTLPEDLLAVIGWEWSALCARKDVWTSKVRLRGKEPRRSASAESKLDTTVRHLVSTLSQPPSTFHDRHARARWGAAFRRAIPLLTALGMIGGVAMLPRAALDDFSPLRMMMFNLPTLLLALAFSMQEMPRVDVVGPARRRQVFRRASGGGALRRAAGGLAPDDDRAGGHPRRNLCRRRAGQDRLVPARVPAGA